MVHCSLRTGKQKATQIKRENQVAGFHVALNVLIVLQFQFIFSAMSRSKKLRAETELLGRRKNKVIDCEIC